MVGVLSTREAIEMAEEASLDLIEISPNAVPPVAKISDSPGKTLCEDDTFLAYLRQVFNKHD